MIHMKLVSHDEIFSNLKEPPIIANHLDTSTEESKKKINDLLFTRYEGDSINIVPSCDCGAVKGGDYVGMRCTECRTVCMSAVERPLESTLWMKVPDGVEAFINPTVWIILSRRMIVSGCNILEWLCDPFYKYEGREPTELKKLNRANVRRGMNYFYQNFDRIMSIYFCDGVPMHEYMEQVSAMNIVPSSTSANTLLRFNKTYDIVKFILENRHLIFSKVLPMPSKVGFVVEANDSGVYVDKTISFALDALHTITSMNNTIVPLSITRRESRVTKAIRLLAEFYQKFATEVISTKPGVLRKHVFGIRLHFTARAVISSNSHNHDYDELQIPWSVAVQLLELHLTNKLYKLGYTPRQVQQLLRESTLQYNPLLDQLFHELIAESGNGIPCVLQRNPTLARGSAQMLRITHVKPDIRDNTFGLSTLILVGFNADFDGDELNLLLLNDWEMAKGFSRLRPECSALDVTQPRSLSRNLNLQAPVAATIDSWFKTPDDFQSVPNMVPFHLTQW